MEQDLVHKIESNPHYRKLVTTRSRFGWILAWLMLFAYYGFILLIAFNKEWMGQRIGSGVMTWGIPIGLLVIVFTVALTGIYIWRANHDFDRLTQALRSEVQQ